MISCNHTGINFSNHNSCLTRSIELVSSGAATEAIAQQPPIPASSSEGGGGIPMSTSATANAAAAPSGPGGGGGVNVMQNSLSNMTISAASEAATNSFAASPYPLASANASNAAFQGRI